MRQDHPLRLVGIPDQQDPFVVVDILLQVDDSGEIEAQREESREDLDHEVADVAHPGQVRSDLVVLSVLVGLSRCLEVADDVLDRPAERVGVDVGEVEDQVAQLAGVGGGARRVELGAQAAVDHTVAGAVDREDLFEPPEGDGEPVVHRHLDPIDLLADLGDSTQDGEALESLAPLVATPEDVHVVTGGVEESERFVEADVLGLGEGTDHRVDRLTHRVGREAVVGVDEHELGDPGDVRQVGRPHGVVALHVGPADDEFEEPGAGEQDAAALLGAEGPVHVEVGSALETLDRSGDFVELVLHKLDGCNDHLGDGAVLGLRVEVEADVEHAFVDVRLLERRDGEVLGVADLAAGLWARGHGNVPRVGGKPAES